MDITISETAFAVVCFAGIWIFFSWVVFSCLQTRCDSDIENCRTNLDLLFRDGKGADTPAWKKHLVAWPLVALGPVIIVIVVLCIIGRQIKNFW